MNSVSAKICRNIFLLYQNLAVEKGPGSIAPLRAKLWPLKEGTRQKRTKSDAKVPLFGNPFSNEHISGIEWSFAKIQKSQIISWALSSHRKRTQVNCTSGSQAMAVQRGYPSVEFLHDSSMFQEETLQTTNLTNLTNQKPIGQVGPIRGQFDQFEESEAKLTD